MAAISAGLAPRLRMQRTVPHLIVPLRLLWLGLSLAPLDWPGKLAGIPHVNILHQENTDPLILMQQRKVSRKLLLLRKSVTYTPSPSGTKRKYSSLEFDSAGHSNAAHHSNSDDETSSSPDIFASKEEELPPAPSVPWQTSPQTASPTMMTSFCPIYSCINL